MELVHNIPNEVLVVQCHTPRRAEEGIIHYSGSKYLLMDFLLTLASALVPNEWKSEVRLLLAWEGKARREGRREKFLGGESNFPLERKAYAQPKVLASTTSTCSPPFIPQNSFSRLSANAFYYALVRLMLHLPKFPFEN